ncbi:hypothetical protein [Flavobacterium sp.]|uniref:hypothetical protein n=1 Tax=Flavobacterium sp. TaxID=239 RepID=UPI002B4AC3F4|nr:hypothetical protein [Flavobacterium sp.]HLF50781.1 hypothetical protein [Flavobacterium sp.]
MRTFQYSRFALTLLVAVFAISLSNCSVHTSTRSSRTSYKAKSLPPGHAKKIHGQKSAKRFAPGHNK